MKKKAFLLLVFLFTIWVRLSAQTLFDIYLKLPDRIGMGELSVREQMVKNYKAGNKQLGEGIYYRFDEVDERNGFLSVTGAFEGLWEMCYWNLPDRKLVAVYDQGCGPVCYIEEFKFFSLKNNQLQEENIEEIIPEIRDIYETFFINYSDEIIKELKEKDILATLLFKLPRKGKDILALFGNESSKEDYLTFARGDRMVLKWNNGKFLMDKIYWAE